MNEQPADTVDTQYAPTPASLSGGDSHDAADPDVAAGEVEPGAGDAQSEPEQDAGDLFGAPDRQPQELQEWSDAIGMFRRLGYSPEDLASLIQGRNEPEAPSLEESFAAELLGQGVSVNDMDPAEYYARLADFRVRRIEQKMQEQAAEAARQQFVSGQEQALRAMKEKYPLLGSNVLRAFIQDVHGLAVSSGHNLGIQEMTASLMDPINQYVEAQVAARLQRKDKDSALPSLVGGSASALSDDVDFHSLSPSEKAEYLRKFAQSVQALQ